MLIHGDIIAEMTGACQKLLTDGEAAELLRMIPSRLKRLARDQQIPYIQLPDGELRFHEPDIWQWVQEHRRGPDTVLQHIDDES